MTDDRHEAVSRRAYELWEKEGGAHGRHEDHWHQAHDEIEAEAKRKTAAKSANQTVTAKDDAEAAKPAAAKPSAAKAAPAKPRAAKPAAAAAAAAKPPKPKTAK